MATLAGVSANVTRPSRHQLYAMYANGGYLLIMALTSARASPCRVCALEPLARLRFWRARTDGAVRYISDFEQGQEAGQHHRGAGDGDGECA
jgi:hypothetical protein